MTTQITDHVAEALTRLKEQFKGQANYIALLEALIAPCQDIEDAFWSLLTERFLDTAVGAQQDIIGKIVGQPRNGLSDDDYPAYLRARIATNRSNGLVEDLIRITQLIVDDDNVTVVVDQQYPAAVVVRIEDTAAVDATTDALISFLRQAKAGGVRLILEYTTHATEPFVFATAAFLNGSHLAGVTTLTVDSTEGFPDTGSLIIDEGLADEETRSYTGKTATTFTGLTATSNAHSANAPVVWDDGIDNGLGDSSDANVGGYLGGAKE